MLSDERLNRIYTTLKSRAKKRGLDFDLSKIDLHVITQPLSCPLRNTPIDYHSVERTDDTPSIDRIDSTKGYPRDNIWIISWKANRCKNNATVDEMVNMANGLKSM